MLEISAIWPNDHFPPHQIMKSSPRVSEVGLMNLDLVPIAVRNIDGARERMRSLLGYEPRTEKVTNTRQEVIVQFLRKANSIDIKLIEPSGPTSPLVEFLKKGGGLHHICFKTDDGEQAIQELANGGARLIAELQPGEAFDDHPIAFMYLGFGLNVEIIDTDLRRAELDQNVPEL